MLRPLPCPRDESPPPPPLQVVTRAASPAAGCAPACQPSVRAAFAALFNLSSTPEGQAAAAAQLRLCEDALLAGGGAPLVALFLMMAFDTAAMGSVPYQYAYFTGKRSREPGGGAGRAHAHGLLAAMHGIQTNYQSDSRLPAAWERPGSFVCRAVACVFGFDCFDSPACRGPRPPSAALAHAGHVRGHGRSVRTKRPRGPARGQHGAGGVGGVGAHLPFNSWRLPLRSRPAVDASVPVGPRRCTASRSLPHMPPAGTGCSGGRRTQRDRGLQLLRQ